MTIRHLMPTTSGSMGRFFKTTPSLTAITDCENARALYGVMLTMITTAAGSQLAGNHERSAPVRSGLQDTEPRTATGLRDIGAREPEPNTNGWQGIGADRSGSQGTGSLSSSNHSIFGLRGTGLEAPGTRAFGDSKPVPITLGRLACGATALGTQGIGRQIKPAPTNYGHLATTRATLG